MSVLKNYDKSTLNNLFRVIDVSYFVNNSACVCDINQFGIDYRIEFDKYVITLHVNCSLMCSVDAVNSKTNERVYANYIFMIGEDETIEQTRFRFAKFLDTYFNISIY